MTNSRTITESTLRRALLGGAGVSAAGAWLAGTYSKDVGALLVLVGWGTLVYAIHRFGRLSPPPS